MYIRFHNNNQEDNERSNCELPGWQDADEECSGVGLPEDDD